MSGHRVTLEMEKLIIDLRSKGEPIRAISKTAGFSPTTVMKVLNQDAAKKRVAAAVLTQAMDKQALREKQKEVLASRLSKMTDRVCDMIEDKIEEGDGKEFAAVLQGLERLDKVSGNTVGEGTRVIHEGLPQQAPQVELKLLIQQVLGR